MDGGGASPGLDADAVEEALGYGDVYGALRALGPALAALGELSPARRGRVLGLFADALALRFDRPGAKEASIARRAAASPDDGAALYDLGYALVDQHLEDLAAPVLEHAVLVEPTQARYLHELVAAYERQGRYQAAFDALKAAPPAVATEPMTRYLKALHGALAGDPSAARAEAPALARDADDRFAFMGQRLRRLVGRADALDATPGGAFSGPDSEGPPTEARAVGGERARHFLTSGAILLTQRTETLSVGAVRGLLDELVVLLAGARLSPPVVLAMADRDSQIVSMAAGRLLNLPVRTWYSGAQPGLVVAWDLAGALPEQRSDMRLVASGQVVFAVTAAGDTESEVAADILGTLGGSTAPPWGGGGATLSFSLDDDLDAAPDDDRDPASIAADVASAAPERDPADAAGLAALWSAASTLAPDLRPAVLGGSLRERRWRHPRAD